MSYEAILSLYDKYGNIMSFNMFLKKILGVTPKNFENLKSGLHNETRVCVRENFNSDEIKELKRLLTEKLSYNEIAKRFGVTKTFLQISIDNLIKTKELTNDSILYESLKLLNEQGMSSEEIMEELRISEEETIRMLNKYKLEKEEENKVRSSQMKQINAESRNKKRKDAIAKRAKRAVFNDEIDDKSAMHVRNYIEECKISFRKGELLVDDMDLLMECMLLVNCKTTEIELFTKMCISFSLYNKANTFITDMISNNKISHEEKGKLMLLRVHVNEAMKKENALEYLKKRF